MLCVEHDLFSLRLQICNRFPNHPPVFFDCYAQDLLCMQSPAFADDRYRRSFGGQKKRDLRVRCRLGVRPAGAAKGANLRMAPLSLFGRVEESDVFWVGSRPSTLDIVNPKRIQLFSDTNLVVDAERNALSLRAVSQGRIIDHDLIRIHTSGLIRYLSIEEFARRSYRKQR